MQKFIISKRKNGEYQFNLKATNGAIILTSEGYKAKASCEKGLESTKKNSEDDSKFDRKKSNNDKWYFNLKAGNGEILGSSEMYESSNGMEKGIESVKTNAPTAMIIEE
ncbi:YegP family protein [Kaistella jeonii]|uniref:DUF1508 domain-containing protein n=1 Tax=Kaistella jeonii TaxID=266749 RepID=A0A0C1FC83_9FLAO|nr:YegP family protein [Kaistella jeonii]KIA90642.1 hypothetical protein OA86_01820 [Kaistella jeonii]SFB69649.1 hypothetical protein SAMN05421876_101158 [Kaistella jeonii]VEI94757.1 Uncharacterized conserved protein [Kaistella jeonii]